MTSFRTVGIDIGGTNVKLAMLWNDGRIVVSREIRTREGDGPAAACERIRDAVHGLMKEHDLDAREMRAVGIDCAGIVDTDANVVLDSPNLRSFERYPLARKLSEAWGVPVRLENDVNAMAYGEWRCGAGRGARNLVCLTLGTGVGGGLILDGRLYRGTHGAAGEVGHVTLDLHGPQCNCPNIGCLERLVGAQYIVERALLRLAGSRKDSRLRDMSPDELSPKVLSLAADAGDEISREILQETGRLLGQALVGLVNIFDPERIIIGGGVARAGDWIFEPARRVVRQHAMEVPAKSVVILPATLGNHASLVGAALLALERTEAHAE